MLMIIPQVDLLTLHTVLTDFGLSRMMSQSYAIGTKTMLAGSPGFQSPEQLRSESTGPPSDVYAFGALAVVLYKRSALWPGLNHYQIMNKVTSNEYPNIDGVPGGMKGICASCFSSVALSRPKIHEILHKLIIFAAS
jgi:serine/threonine protein kinase